MLEFPIVIVPWMQLLESLGIVGGLLFSGMALRSDVRSRKIDNHIKLAEGYRSIWSLVFADSSLDRIRRKDVDLNLFPITPSEDRIARFVLQNVLLAFEARRAGQLGDIGNLEADISAFLSNPIPRQVWGEIERFQPKPFRDFVNGLL